MKLAILIKSAFVAASLLSSVSAFASYGDDAADAYLATMDAIKEDPSIVNDPAFIQGRGVIVQMFENMYAQGLARKGTGFVPNEQEMRQNLLNHFQRNNIGGGAKENMQLANQLIVAFKDGLEGKDFTTATSVAPATAPAGFSAMSCTVDVMVPVSAEDSKVEQTTKTQVLFSKKAIRIVSPLDMTNYQIKDTDYTFTGMKGDIATSMTKRGQLSMVMVENIHGFNVSLDDEQNGKWLKYHDCK